MKLWIRCWRHGSISLMFLMIFSHLRNHNLLLRVALNFVSGKRFSNLIIWEGGILVISLILERKKNAICVLSKTLSLSPPFIPHTTDSNDWRIRCQLLHPFFFIINQGLFFIFDRHACSFSAMFFFFYLISFFLFDFLLSLCDWVLLLNVRWLFFLIDWGCVFFPFNWFRLHFGLVFCFCCLSLWDVNRIVFLFC